MKRDSAGNGPDGPPSKFQRPQVDLTNVAIRFLVPARAAGIMIGKGGENIKKMRSQVCCCPFVKIVIVSTRINTD